MTPTKPINVEQLQTEAAALPSTTHTHGFSYDSGANLLWCAMAGARPTDPLCASGQTAYNAHVAVPLSLTPTFLLLPAAGVGATGQVSSGSDDLLMAGTIHTGSVPSAGDVLAVTFGTPRAAVPLAIAVGALNVQAGTLIAKNITAAGFTIATAAVPAANTTYTLYAHVLG